jgi:ABC-type bacteriocin/lantibiotic exporter with double-glycine peptidase domain
MIFIFLLIAIAIIYLAVTQRLQGIEQRLTMYWEKAKVAFQYWIEDVSDVGTELNAQRIADAHTFISALPEGCETMIGERGKLLSGGQRQCISIARAILKHAPILVFDEATSAVDNQTEAAIQRSIDRFTKNRTAILIAPRLSTVRNVSCIHIMADGKIIESGTHEQLLALNCSYAALWRVQTGEIKHDYAA